MAARPLTSAMADLWRLAAEAATAGLTDTANANAAAAVDASGWERYPLRMAVSGVQFRICDLLPAGWVFYRDSGQWDQLFLVPTDASRFLTRNRDLVTLIASAQAAVPPGGGLIELPDLFRDVISATVDIPDTLPQGWVD